jgi:sugar lactone lactonase YvrE
MNLLKTIRINYRNRAGDTTPSTHRNFGATPFTCTARGLFAIALAAVLSVVGMSQASAQTAPAYTVFSQTTLTGSGSANPTIMGGGGYHGNAAANSRGDFFVNQGNGYVYEFPANGGPAFVLFSDPKSTGAATVAVDPYDNLFIGDYNYNLGPSNNYLNTLLYEFPNTNGTYPAPYTLNPSQPPPSCNPAVAATSTTAAVAAQTQVCAVGSYVGAAYYYWSGWWGIGVDGAGDVYSASSYDNHYSGAFNNYSAPRGVFQCQIFCAEQIPGNGSTTYTTILPNNLLSIAVNYAGDLYVTDASTVSVVYAKGSASTNNAPVVFDSTYNSPYGVSFDPSGNLYVTDRTGVWEVPAVETTGGGPCKGGTDSCTLTASSKYLVIHPSYTGSSGVYNGQLAPGVDNRGNFIFAPYYGGLFKYSLFQGNFPSAQIGASGSTSLNFTVSFNKATTLTSFAAVQGSGPSTEFTVSPGSCMVGTAFAALSTCNFTATFTPSGLGVRTGAVVITDTTGKSTYTFLSGTGTGTGVTVDPGTPTSIGSGYKKPMGVAVDQARNVYVADSTANTVQEYPLGGGTAISIGTGLNVPTGVAVDSSGNVYIVNQGTGATGGSVVEVPNVAGVLTNSAQTTLASGLNLPTDIILDNAGDLFITATGSNQVLQLSNIDRDSATAAMIPRGYGLSAPTGLAMDSNGNLFVADTGNNRVLEIGDGFQLSIGSGLTAPVGVTTDPSGSVIIADGTGRLIRVPNETYGNNPIGLNQADQQVLSSPLSYPYSVRSDNSGNLYVSDNVAAVVDKLQRTTGAINFGNWNLNTLSDAQSIVLSNIGTNDVTIGNPPFPALPAGSEFAVTTGSGSSACGGGPFHSGYQCTVSATFDPTVPGTQTYPLVFSAPAQNTAAPTVNLSGTGVNEAAATLKLIQVAPTTTTITYGQQIIISAKVSPTSSATVPTGYVVFNFDGQNQRPVKLDATGAASITFNGLNAGSNTLSAYYEGDTNYASLNSAVLPLIIVQATSTNVLTGVGDSAVPLSVQPTDTITFTDVLTPAVAGAFTGTVNFIDVASNTPLNPTPIRLGSPDPKTGAYTVSYSFQPSAQSQTTAGGTFNVVAVYSGNIDYSGNSSATIPYVSILSTYTITPDKTSVTATASAPGVVNLTVTDYSNFEGNVSLTCSGLPANAYCIFRPASAQLIPAVSTTLLNTQITPLTIYPVPVVLQIAVDQNINVVEGSAFWITALVFGLAALVWRKRIMKGKLGLPILAIVLCMAGLTALSGCSTGVNNGYPTPAGTYAVTITGTATPAPGGNEPACSYQNCSLPPGPSNPSINVVKTLTVNVTVK